MFFESLENRRLLAFTAITAAFSNGTLTITGSATGSNLTIAEDQSTPGKVLVQDMGMNQEMTYLGVKALNVTFKNADNTLYVTPNNTMKCTIKGGTRQDYIRVDEEGTGTANIDAGPGNDLVSLIRANNDTVNGNKGDDSLYINRGIQTDWWGAADQTAVRAHYHSQKATLLGGDGNDQIGVYEGSSITVDGGGGTNTLIDYSATYGGSATYASKKNIQSSSSVILTPG